MPPRRKTDNVRCACAGDTGRRADVFRGHNLAEGTYSPRVFGGQARVLWWRMRGAAMAPR
jgi:hypothetical protein